MKILDWKNGFFSVVWENIPFVMGGDKFLVDCVNLFKSGKSQQEVINYLSSVTKLSTNEVGEYATQIEEAVFFAEHFVSEDAEAVPETQSMFTLNLTRNCNLNCKHCYAGGAKACNEMSIDTIGEVIDFMDSRMVKPRLMIITGGEPTLEKEKLRYAIRRGKEHGFKIRVNSNGILIDANLAEFFFENDIMVQLSLDGIDAETHALLRNSKASYEEAIRSVRVLKKYDVKFALSFTVHSKNVHQLSDMVDFALQLGAEKLNTSSLVQIGNAKLNDLKTVEYADEFKALYEAVKNDKRKQHLTRATLFAETIIAIRDGIKFTQCGTGNCTACVDSTGEIYPCLNMMLSEYQIANARYGNLAKQYKNNLVLERFSNINIDTLNSKCRECFFRYWCGGFCRGETIANGGRLTDPYVRCASWKKGLLFILKCLAENPELYSGEGLYE